MNPIYETLYDAYAEPILKEDCKQLEALLSSLTLPDEDRLDLLDQLTSLWLQRATNTFAVGLHLGLSLLPKGEHPHNRPGSAQRLDIR